MNSKEALKLCRAYNLKISKTTLKNHGMLNGFLISTEEDYYTEYDSIKLLSWLKSRYDVIPDGYITINQYSEDSGLDTHTVYYYMRKHNLKFTKLRPEGSHIKVLYFKKDEMDSIIKQENRKGKNNA